MEGLARLKEVREMADRQRALKPVDVRFEEFNGKPIIQLGLPFDRLPAT